MTDNNGQPEIENPQFDDETCERYLLGELSEAERERFEEAYFADDELFERFLAVKDELLDSYARGEMPEEKRARFARQFAATAPRRRQVDETKEFIQAVTAVSAKTATGADVNAPVSSAAPKSFWQSLSDFLNSRTFAWQAALATILLIALGGAWLVLRNRQDEQVSLQPTPTPTISLPTNENNNINTSNESVNTVPSPTPANINQSAVNQNSSPTPTPKPIDRPPKISAPQMASVLLMPLATRDINEANTLRLDSGTQTARVGVVFKDDAYRSFSATITTLDGATVWQQKNLKASASGRNKSVALQIPSAVLRGQDYIVTLEGQTAAGQTETINEYYFRVERRSSQNTPTTTPKP